MVLMKLSMMLRLKCIQGISYLEAVLIKYKLLKFTFISELEIGI